MMKTEWKTLKPARSRLVDLLVRAVAICHAQAARINEQAATAAAMAGSGAPGHQPLNLVAKSVQWPSRHGFDDITRVSPPFGEVV